MDNWQWTVKSYYTPQIAAITKTRQRTPKLEQWIYLYHGQKEAEMGKQTTFCLKKIPQNKSMP